MVFGRSKLTPLQRRIRELEREAALVRGDVKVLSHALKRSDEGISWKRLKTVPAPSVPERPAAASAAKGGEADELFGWKARREAEEAREAAPAAPVEEAEKPERRSGRAPVMKDGRRFTVDNQFASYFTSGSFTGGPVQENKSVQRNKAIFMVLLVLIAVFILVWRFI